MDPNTAKLSSLNVTLLLSSPGGVRSAFISLKEVDDLLVDRMDHGHGHISFISVSDLSWRY